MDNAMPVQFMGMGGDEPRVAVYRHLSVIGPAPNAFSQRTVHLLVTDALGTEAALPTAVALARGGGARLQVLVPQVVPFPLALESSNQLPDFAANRVRSMLEALGVEADVQVCLCRAGRDVVRVLPPASTVVLGGQLGRWLQRESDRLARHLQARGHHVVLVPIPGGDSSLPASGGGR